MFGQAFLQTLESRSLPRRFVMFLLKQEAVEAVDLVCQTKEGQLAVRNCTPVQGLFCGALHDRCCVSGANSCFGSLAPDILAACCCNDLLVIDG